MLINKFSKKCNIATKLIKEFITLHGTIALKDSDYFRNATFSNSVNFDSADTIAALNQMLKRRLSAHTSQTMHLCEEFAWLRFDAFLAGEGQPWLRQMNHALVADYTGGIIEPKV